MTERISGDHTFKICSSVGIRDPRSGTWVRQFTSVYILVNAYNQILAFQFTETQDIDGLSTPYYSVAHEARPSSRGQGSS